jgi:putative transposase
MDFVYQLLVDGRWFRVLTVLDQCTREWLRPIADRSLSGREAAAAMESVVRHRGAPQAVSVDNGSEFASRELNVWTYQHRVELDFIEPVKQVASGFILKFNGRLPDECLNVECFFSLQDAREALECWWEEYNRARSPRPVGIGRSPRSRPTVSGTHACWLRHSVDVH